MKGEKWVLAGAALGYEVSGYTATRLYVNGLVESERACSEDLPDRIELRIDEEWYCFSKRERLTHK